MRASVGVLKRASNMVTLPTPGCESNWPCRVEGEEELAYTIRMSYAPPVGQVAVGVGVTVGVFVTEGVLVSVAVPVGVIVGVAEGVGGHAGMVNVSIRLLN